MKIVVMCGWYDQSFYLKAYPLIHAFKKKFIISE